MFSRWQSKHIIQEHDTLFQQEKINELKAAIGPLSGRSLKFCTDSCLRRYLKDRNWNVIKSKNMLEETLRWRSSYKPEEIRWHEIDHEGEAGKAYLANFKDRDGRTILILKPGTKSTRTHENQIRFLVYFLENALTLPEGQEELVWLVDFAGWSVNTVPLKTARATINVVQNHYPQMLSVGILYKPPRIFEAFWKAIKIFLHSTTVQKAKFVYPNNGESLQVMQKYFDLDKLPVEFGGKNEMKYNHKEYSKLMRDEDIKKASIWGSDRKVGHDTCEKPSAPATMLESAQAN